MKGRGSCYGWISHKGGSLCTPFSNKPPNPRHARPESSFRPAACASPFDALRRIGLPLERVRRFRQGMQTQWEDHERRVFNGEAVVEKGQEPAVATHHGRWSDTRGLITDAVPAEARAGRVVWWLGRFWETGDQADIVPIQRAVMPGSDQNAEFLSQAFGRAFADQGLLEYFRSGFDQGDAEAVKANYSFSPRNQKSAERFWWWENDALALMMCVTERGFRSAPSRCRLAGRRKLLRQ